MSEVKKGNGLVYKNHPLRRIDNLIYYGSMADKYIVLLQILDTKKEQDMDVATRVSVQLQLTDPEDSFIPYHIFRQMGIPPVSHKGGESYTGLSPRSGAVLMNHEGGIPLVHRKKQFISRRLPAGAREFARQLRGVSVSVCSHAAAGPAPV